MDYSNTKIFGRAEIVDRPVANTVLARIRGESEMSKVNFEKMNLKELWKFWIKDWEQEAPELENVDTMCQWEKATDKRIGEATLFELIEANHIAYREEIDYLEQMDYMHKRIFSLICESLEERVDVIEKSVKLLLKEHEQEPAKITIGQLNRLKGGVSH